MTPSRAVQFPASARPARSTAERPSLPDWKKLRGDALFRALDDSARGVVIDGHLVRNLVLNLNQMGVALSKSGVHRWLMERAVPALATASVEERRALAEPLRSGRAKPEAMLRLSHVDHQHFETAPLDRRLAATLTKLGEARLVGATPLEMLGDLGTYRARVEAMFEQQTGRARLQVRDLGAKALERLERQIGGTFGPERAAAARRDLSGAENVELGFSATEVNRGFGDNRANPYGAPGSKGALSPAVTNLHVRW